MSVIFPTINRIYTSIEIFKISCWQDVCCVALGEIFNFLKLRTILFH